MSQSLLSSSLLNQFGSRDAEAEPLDRRALGQIALCAVFILLVVLGPFSATLTSDGAEEGSAFRQISYLLMFIAAIVSAAPWRRGWEKISMPIPMIVALVWCWASVFWAIEPAISVRRLLLTTLVIWTVFIIVHSVGYRRAIDGLRVGMVAALAINYLTVLAVPQVGIHLGTDPASTALAGNWRGIMTHKNFAGAACAITILLFLLDAKHINVKIRVAVVLAATYFVYRSVSKTSIGMTVLAATIGYGYNLLNRQLRLLLIPLAIIVICAVATFTSAYHDVATRAYMDPTSFTGRGQIWAMLIRYITDHPLLGAGFESFWGVGTSSPSFTYGKGFVTTITVGHNGYLDLLATVGIPGLLLIVAAAIVWPLIQVITNERISRGKGGLLCAMILFCMGHNVTESSLFERDALTGVFTIFVAAFAAYTLSGARKSRKSNKKSRQAGDDIMAQMRSRHGK